MGTLGLPQILIEFKNKAESVIKRSGGGVVALVLRDSTTVTFDTKVYKKASDIASADWSAANKDLIEKAFLGSPKSVIVERIAVADDIAVALARLANKNFNYIAAPNSTDDTAEIAAWVILQRADFKKTYKAVLANSVSDNEGIINFATDDIKVGAKTYTTLEYTARIAGILAGVPLNQSATYYELSEVGSITESTAPDDDIDDGKLILINDGSKIKIGRGVNSLTTVTAEKGEDFKKIKIVEAMDLVRDDIRDTFADNYVGKVANSYNNKVIFLSAVNNYFKTLQQDGVLYDKFENKAEIDLDGQRVYLASKTDISNWSDEQIKTASTGSFVFAMANIKPQDAMEDLKFSINI